MKPFDIQSYLAEKRAMVDRELDTLLPKDDVFPAQLHRAMRYCLFAGGKRLRPILALSAAEAVGGDSSQMLTEACTLELIHTYTLIHDDLPSMDDDDYRRGCPATHRVFGEAVAILAGDALLTEAFRLLAAGLQRGDHSPDKTAHVIHLVAEACGSRGIIGGQVVDVDSENKNIERQLLDYIHTHKTGKFITASVMMGAVLGGGSPEAVGHLQQYSSAIGLAFQITDDILDVMGKTKDLGKSVGSDEKRGKATYPALLGMEESIKVRDRLYRQSLEALRPFWEKAQPLREIATLIVERTK